MLGVQLQFLPGIIYRVLLDLKKKTNAALENKPCCVFSMCLDALSHYVLLFGFINMIFLMAVVTKVDL